jgi:magnesium chelatase subunit D
MSVAPPEIVAPWADAMLAAALFAVDPHGSGGVSLRAPAGPVRDRWLAALSAMLPDGTPQRRLPPGTPDSRLLGGLDLAATLRAGRPVAERGLLAATDGGIVVLSMAERADDLLSARLGAALDSGTVTVERDGFAAISPARIGIVALDEGVDDERPPAALLDRLAFAVDLGQIGPRDAGEFGYGRDRIAAARDLLAHVEPAEAVIGALCGVALALGIVSIRPSILAFRVARAAAALGGRTIVSEDDAAVAARLVLAPRALRIPASDSPGDAPDPDAADAPPDAPPGEAPDEAEMQEDDRTVRDMQDIVLEAAQAALPADLLAGLVTKGAERGGVRLGGRAGALRQSANRGRPIGVRRGDPRSGARLDLIETLRAAAPWQALRRDSAPGGRVRVRRDDFRIKRFEQRAGTTTIFVVDASGSAALRRLAEAKGAVELLLADCYVRRDQVALLAFRGAGVEIALPPTRSLTRAKRSLAGLPGGGGTPLAAAIEAACVLAEAERRKGQTPVIVFLTDGGANIARDGRPGRARARDEATAAARALRLRGHAAMLVDTSQKPQPVARDLAAAMDARYLPLPYADAAAVSRAVQAGIR